MIWGCVMTVYHVEAGKEELILKMSWPISTQKPSEIYLLQMAKNAHIEGVPELVAWEDVNLYSQKDTTDNIHGHYRNFLSRVNSQV